LKDCRSKGLSDDWKFNIAYNAALQASNAALVASGYAVAKGDSNHFRVIQSLAHTVGLDAKGIADFDDRRKKRGMSVYDTAGVITRQEANQMIDFAKDLLARVKQWLIAQHPELAEEETE